MCVKYRVHLYLVVCVVVDGLLARCLIELILYAIWVAIIESVRHTHLWIKRYIYNAITLSLALISIVFFFVCVIFV